VALIAPQHPRTGVSLVNATSFVLYNTSKALEIADEIAYLQRTKTPVPQSLAVLYVIDGESDTRLQFDATPSYGDSSDPI